MSLLQRSLSGGAMILVLLALRALALHRLPKRLFPACWNLVLLRLLAHAALPSSVSVYALIAGAASAGTEAAQDAEVLTQALPALALAGGTGGAARLSWLTVLWAAGMLAVEAVFLLSWFRRRLEFETSLPVEREEARRWLAERRMKRPLSIRQSDRVSSPLAYGIFRPVILVPKDLDWADGQRLDYILTHEYLHIRRLDAVRKLAMAAAVCIHWFNPLVWVMLAVLNRDIELACDEGVLRRAKGDARAAYARTLIAMKERGGRTNPLYSGFGKTAIEERVTAIMKRKKTSPLAVCLAAMLVAGTAAVFSTSAAAGGRPEGGLSGRTEAASADSAAVESGAETDPAREAGLAGSWRLDAQTTGQRLQGYDSLAELFGTGLGAYGAELDVSDGGWLTFSIGAGPAMSGQLVQNQEGCYTAEVGNGLLSGPEQVRVYLAGEAEDALLVLEYLGEALYWYRAG